MKWIVVVISAVLGGMLGDTGRVLLGLLGGAALGWTLGTVFEMRARLEALELQLRRRELTPPEPQREKRDTAAQTSTDLSGRAESGGEPNPADPCT